MKKILALVLLAFGVAHAANTVPPQLISPTGSTAGQAVVSTGPSTAPGWATVTAGSITPISANSVYANFTGASASPIAKAVPSCSTANSALQYTSGTGLSCGAAFALTSGNLSQFASTTSSQLAGVLSDETGTGSAVFSASPTFTGTVSASSINATGAITPSQTVGIVGTTTNNNANAGSVGEFVTATGTGISLTNNIGANITSISLTAGDWDVTGAVEFDANATTNITGVIAGINTTSATLPSAPFKASILANIVTGGAASIVVPTTRISITGTTTVYIIGQCSFNTSTATATGFIRARRVR